MFSDKLKGELEGRGYEGNDLFLKKVVGNFVASVGSDVCGEMVVYLNHYNDPNDPGSGVSAIWFGHKIGSLVMRLGKTTPDKLPAQLDKLEKAVLDFQGKVRGIFEEKP